MNSALAIASVTAVLKSLLDNRLAQHGVTGGLGEVTVTALPPDRVTTGTDERCQINLFLYRVTPNTSWRQSRLGLTNGRDGAGKEAAHDRPPPLALDLHYLITAYGEQDFQAEILLGQAMLLLHQTAVLTAERILAALVPPDGVAGLPPARAMLAEAGLADQGVEIRVTPEFTSSDEMSRLWSALQARYRPSAAYKVSAVLLGTPDGEDGEDGEVEAMPTGSRGRPVSRGGRR